MVYADRRGLFLNGKAEAASGAPTCEKRVNTFSFCGTGGSLRKNGAKVILCPSFFGLKAKNRKKTASKQLPERFFYDIIIWQVQRRPHGQAVKTSPSHGENRGSSPRGATKKRAQAKACALFLVFRRNREPRRGSRERGGLNRGTFYLSQANSPHFSCRPLSAINAASLPENNVTSTRSSPFSTYSKRRDLGPNSTAPIFHSCQTPTFKILSHGISRIKTFLRY